MKQLRFKVSGLALNCVDYGGEGLSPLLFIHGGSAHARWWDFVAPAFTKDFHVLALDQRGHGESEWCSEWAYGSRHYVADIDAIIEGWGFGAPVLIGHSMGAHNALLYASMHAEKLRAMVAIDSPLDYSTPAIAFLRSFADKPSRRYATLDEACANFRVLPREHKARAEIMAHVGRLSYMRLPDGSWTHKLDRRTLIREPLDLGPILPRLSCPALIIKVKESPVLDIDTARKMVSAVARGRLAELDNSFHHAMLDNPEGLVALLRDFFDTLK
ncbi:MAG: alpha/beta fold hydrolase [Candidatus Binataceae bacterium]